MGMVTKGLHSDTEDMPPFSLMGYINDVADTKWYKGDGEEKGIQCFYFHFLLMIKICGFYLSCTEICTALM